MINLATLKSELQSDPKSVGYATPLGAGNLSAVAALLNNPTANRIGLASITADQLSALLLAAAPKISALTDVKQAAWDRRIRIVQGMTAVDLTNANVQQLFKDAKADGILTDLQITALTTKLGSRAEVLFGVGTVVTFHDCANALRS